ncbi:hypothetical protein C6V83_02045 [Gordonia iterans]|uniref:Glycine transporter domain-containing protein n=1 Tax=Gordonia iterans TaxID=1004901 RepID=A0A2S0KC92_9ACTN|nr:TRIC cation channel family protein [Gordonia iterans]AVL99260.1 hypothetical protein C6V83_02045 [Gordonia iterans]
MAGINETLSVVHHFGEGAAVAAFGAAGALVAVRRQMDVVGILMLSAVTALGGGIVRDVISGTTPPYAFRDMHLLAIAVAAGFLVFLWNPPARLTAWPLDIADAIGLGLFAVTGTILAHDAGLSTPGAALLGMTSAIGGGVIRDVLSGSVPSVLRPGEHLYAIPALLCASAVSLLVRYADYQEWMGMICAAAAIALRLASLRFGWHGPQPRYARRGDTTT